MPPAEAPKRITLCTYHVRLPQLTLPWGLNGMTSPSTHQQRTFSHANDVQSRFDIKASTPGLRVEVPPFSGHRGNLKFEKCLSVSPELPIASKCVIAPFQSHPVRVTVKQWSVLMPRHPPGTNA